MLLLSGIGNVSLSLQEQIVVLCNAKHDVMLKCCCLQIAEIRNSSAKLIQEITDYQADRTNRAEQFISGLVVKKEDLEELQKDFRGMLANGSVVELIRQKGDKTLAFKQEQGKALGECNWEDRLLDSLGMCCDLEDKSKSYKICCKI